MGAGMAGVGAVAGAAQLSSTSRSALQGGVSGTDPEGTGAETSILLNGHNGAAKEGTAPCHARPPTTVPALPCKEIFWATNVPLPCKGGMKGCRKFWSGPRFYPNPKPKPSPPMMPQPASILLPYERCIQVRPRLTAAAVELACAGVANTESSGGGAASQPAPSNSPGFSRQYARGIACAVYVGVANGSFLVSCSPLVLPEVCHN